jgi:H+/Cl- antiporter ClcA
MPITPYHFGPNGFIGLIFRRWIDLPVIILANVVTDVEVLFAKGWPVHQHWHFHTLLVGAAVGVCLGLAAFPLKPLFAFLMKLLKIPYQPKLWKMILAGIIGVWLHVLFDSFYHYDVQIFWPYQHNPLWKAKLLTQTEVKVLCLGFWFIALAIYGLILLKSFKQNNLSTALKERKK